MSANSSTRAARAVLEMKWHRAVPFILWNGYELCAECGKVMVNDNRSMQVNTSPGVFYYAHTGICHDILKIKERIAELLLLDQGDPNVSPLIMSYRSDLRRLQGLAEF